jgi:hypothetical protein
MSKETYVPLLEIELAANQMRIIIGPPTGHQYKLLVNLLSRVEVELLSRSSTLLVPSRADPVHL